jgi:hypothetical protein
VWECLSDAYYDVSRQVDAALIAAGLKPLQALSRAALDQLQLNLDDGDEAHVFTEEQVRDMA